LPERLCADFGTLRQIVIVRLPVISVTAPSISQKEAPYQGAIGRAAQRSAAANFGLCLSEDVSIGYLGP
jgi:hypothetical protein